MFFFTHFNDGKLKNKARGGQLHRRQTGSRDRGSHLPIRSEVVCLVNPIVVVISQLFEVADFDRANMSSRNHLNEGLTTHNRPR
jgi:hypothetical protein